MRRWGLAVLALLAVLSLTACDPAPPVGTTGGVWLDVEIGVDGGATATIAFDESPRTDDERMLAGTAVADRLFPSATVSDVALTNTRGAYRTVTITFDDVYAPGWTPTAAVDTRPAAEWLLANGARTLDVTIDTPRVPVDGSWVPTATSEREGAYWIWDCITSSAAAPHGELTMNPVLWLGLLDAAASILAIGFLVAAFVAWWRRPGYLCMAFAVTALVFTGLGLLLINVGGIPVNNLGVLGLISAPVAEALLVLGVFAFLAFFVEVAAMILFARGGRRRRPVFLAPPGWPTPAPGWLPPPGWTPDPEWPAAPPDWQWYRPGRRDDPR